MYVSMGKVITYKGNWPAPLDPILYKYNNVSYQQSIQYLRIVDHGSSGVQTAAVVLLSTNTKCKNII